MRKFAWLAALAIGVSTLAIAGNQVAVLDGTSWKLEVEPDSMAKEKGEKQYKEILTFADGMVTMSEGQKVGFASATYEVGKSGEKDWTFKTEQESETAGRSIWTT